MLVQAAAQQWKVDSTTLRTESGQVIDDAHGGRKLSYGELAPHAAKLPAPQKVQIKDDKDLKLIGHPVHRLDAIEKGNGTAQYGMDVRLPGMKYAALAASPVVGGKLAHVDASKMDGSLQLVQLDDMVAVVGPDFWSALKGLRALNITWDSGLNGQLNSAQIWKDLRATSEKKGVEAVSMGDADKGLADGARLDVAYELPFLSHAPMEPQNFTVHVTPGACEMWGGSQVQTGAVAAAAKTLGITPDKVTFHNYTLGGGFGRRLDTDMVEKAARIAQNVDSPVKVIWTREEDITQDMYRPAYRNVMSASLSPDGKINGWMHRIAGGSVQVRMSGQPLKGGLDRGNVDGALDNIYGVPNFRVEYIQSEPRAINLGYWRGVAPNNTIFAIESLIDELAIKAAKDPVAFRLANLDRTPRLKACVQIAAQKAGWSNALPARRGRGICAQFAFGTYIATVAEVEVDDDGQVRVHKFTSAIDAGRIVNPDGMIAQLQGGLMFGTTAALFGEITVKNGRVQQSNFNNYRIMRMNEAPATDITVIKSTEAPGGIGEPGCTAGPPSVVNAIAAATGVRLRTLPIDRDLLARKTA
jgi:isoquinoline 1-oxidoreductase beta subunit